MKNIFNKKNIIIFTIIIVGISIFSFLYKPKQPLPQLLLSSPVEGSTRAPLTDPIQLKFDQEIDLTQLAINSTPTEEWSFQPSDNKFDVIIKSKQYLRVETKYTLNILYNNQPIASLNFKTIPQQGDPRYTQEVLKEMDRDYPIAVKLPYNSSVYRVVYSSPMTLEISIKNPSISQEKAISEIRDWVTSVGGDASAHKYVVSDKPLPSFTPTGLPENRSTKTPIPSPTPFDWSTLKDDGT